MRRVALTAALVAVAVALLGGLLLLWDLHRIREDVNAARSAFDDLTLAEVRGDELVDVASRSQTHLDAAAGRARRSLPLRVLGGLPVSDVQVDALRHLTTLAAELGASASLAAEEVDAALAQANEPDGRVHALEVAQRNLQRIEHELRTADLGDDGGLIGPVADARRSLAGSLASILDRVTAARRWVTPLHSMMRGPTTLALLVANNAEMAGGAGLALSTAPLHIEDGLISLGPVVPAADVRLPTAVALPLDLGTIYAPTGIGADLRSSTRSPNLPLMGRSITELLGRAGAPPADGVLVVDAVALAEVMEVSGPVTVDTRRIEADEVLAEVLHESYRRFDLDGGRDERVSFQGDVARAVFESLTTQHVPPIALAEALADAARGRHLMLWSSDPGLQRAWRELGAAGELPSDGLMVSFQNFAADKLDWYLRPTAALDVRVLPNGDYGVRLTATMHVPRASELPDASPYILGPDPDGHGVFLTVHLPGAAYDITTPDASGFTTKGMDPPLHVRTFIDDVRGGSTLTRRVDFKLPRSHSSMLLLPSARIEPLPLVIDGEVEVDDAEPRRITWLAAAPTDAGGSQVSTWVRALTVVGLAASVMAAWSLAAAARRPSVPAGPRTAALVASQVMAGLALGFFAAAALVALLLSVPRV